MIKSLRKEKKKAFGHLVFYLAVSSTIGYHTLTDLFENFLGLPSTSMTRSCTTVVHNYKKKKKSTTVLVIIINVQYYKSNDTPNLTNNKIACYD